MVIEDKSFSKKKKQFTIILAFVAFLTAFASSLPTVQNYVKSIFTKPGRQILAKITGFYGVDQTEYLILKIKELVIEPKKELIDTNKS